MFYLKFCFSSIRYNISFMIYSLRLKISTRLMRWLEQPRVWQHYWITTMLH